MTPPASDSDEENKEEMWWGVGRCKGKKKDGSLCRNTARRATEISIGNLYVPFTCHIHKEQEEEIRKTIPKPSMKDLSR